MRIPSILAITVGILLAASPSIAAADFPMRPLQIVVPFTAGGNTDTIARLLAEHMQDSLKQPVTVPIVRAPARTSGRLTSPTAIQTATRCSSTLRPRS
jgi:hypothetical protein